MVYLLGVVAAACLGVGWVMQQQVAGTAGGEGGLSWSVLRRLIGTWTWWGGIAAMTVGQSLAAWALQTGPVTIVEPLLVTCLLFAFAFVAHKSRHRVQRRELLGTLVVIAGVAVFLLVAHPRADADYRPSLLITLLAAAAAAGAATVCVVVARVAGIRFGPAATAAGVAVGAGILYALQDAATRGGIVVMGSDGAAAALRTSWPYLLLAAATAAVLLSQYAFRMGRLDLALPPTAAAQPIVGIALGIFMLDDRITVTVGGIWIEAASIGLVLLGVVVVGRSRALRRGAAGAEPMSARRVSASR